MRESEAADIARDLFVPPPWPRPTCRDAEWASRMRAASTRPGCAHRLRTIIAGMTDPYALDEHLGACLTLDPVECR
jgi:dGTP triphosphohydrolase